MKQPYLIQKAKFADDTDRPGIDSIIRCEYMGSAEFEFGALPKSLARIREKIKEYAYFQYSFTNAPSKVVTIFCKKSEAHTRTMMVQMLAEGSFQLKESCDLKYWVYPGMVLKNYCDFYWDIENDFMFWKFSTEFEAKFKKIMK